MRSFKLTRLGVWFGVLALGCLIIGTTRALAMVPPRTTAIHLHNKTDQTLYLTNYALPNGDWTPKLKPPAEIKPGATGYWKSEAGGVASLSGPKGNIRYSIGNATWHTPFGISPNNAVRPQGDLLSVSHSPDAIDVFYVGADGSIQCVWWTVKANKWSAPYSVAPANSAGTGSPLEGFSRAPGHMDIYWITPNGEVATRPFANGNWGTAFNISGPGAASKSSLAAVHRGKENIDVFWIGTDGAIYSNSWRGERKWPEPIRRTPAKSATTTSSLAAISRTNDEIHVFYVNQESAISTVWWRGNWNRPTQITGRMSVSLGSRLAAVALDPKHLAVFWVNSGAIYTSYSHADKDGGKWQAPSALSPEKTVERTSPVLALNRTSTHIDVFWRSLDGTIMTSYFQSGGQWNKPFVISPAKASSEYFKIAVAARVNHHVDVFWVDGKGAVATNWWDAKSVQDIYISWTNPLADSQYGNTYHEQAPPGFSLAYTGGTGSHADVKYVLEKSSKHMVKDFKPSKHGFKFANNDWEKKNIKLGVVTIDLPKPVGKLTITNSTQGLCGGMVFAVMDYFQAGKPIPPDTTPPAAEQAPLYKYLRQRLFDSFDVTGTGANYLKFMRHDYPDADEGVVQGLGLMKGRSYVIAREEWPKIKADIDANKLSPIGLVQTISYSPGDIGKNHQVLVYGYQLSGENVTLYYYDPTFPNEDRMELRFAIGNLSKRIDILRFIGPDYKPKTINTFFRTPYKPTSMARP